jgi:hypothetical protein
MSLPDYRPWQERELAALPTRRPKWACWAAPRLGKTYLSSSELRAIWDLYGFRRAVVTAPLRVLPIWKSWLEAVGLDPIVGYERPSAEIAAMLKEQKPEGVLLLNDDRLGVGRATARTQKHPRANLIDPIIKWLDGGPYVADEVHRFATPSSQRGCAARRLMRSAGWGRHLTGTPAPNNIGGLWGHLVGLDPDALGTYTDYTARYLITNPLIPSQILGYRTENLDRLRAIILAMTTIVRREDVFGPDQWQVVERELDLPDDVRKIYDQLANDWILENRDEPVLNVLARMTLFQQITSGFLPTDDGRQRELHRVKIDAVLGDLNEIVASREKAVVYHRFLWEGDEVIRELRRWPNLDVFVVRGGVKPHEAQEVQDKFRASRRAVAVVQMQGAEGLDFATAVHAMFISQNFSFINYTQACDRVVSPGKVRVVTFYRMRDTIDGLTKEIVERKKDLHLLLTHIDKASLTKGIIK